MKLTAEERKFLIALKQDGEPTASFRLPLATRAQDKARARAKKFGWAVFDRKVWGWRLLEAGRQVLAEERE